MTIKQIVEQYLRANGYDGLCTEDCGCFLGDLFCCCCEAHEDCKPGYKGRNEEGIEIIQEKPWK